ncbi:hypothetical protein AG1IA_09845 [Rhizoctonia solani AG-1 IA]|uniref:Uncharacterized protein n=1 Tax=Thanatephorus cucumeris (strain AG1-IA) TaxID=983506 RepID=L8WDU9_THACA|nr:hypothetical protein AG1IA_09845 [Rhizoctonia solani AG-1 IA]
MTRSSQRNHSSKRTKTTQRPHQMKISNSILYPPNDEFLAALRYKNSHPPTRSPPSCPPSRSDPVMACSEVEFKSDLHPVGAQIFVRAPRSFKHPSWAVRPEAARMLDAPLKALNESDTPLVETVRVLAKDASVVVDEAEEMIWWGWDGRLAGYA